MRPCIMGLILVSSVCSSSSWGRGGGVLAVVCHITATAPCCHVMSSLLFFIHWLFMESVQQSTFLSLSSFLVWPEPELSVCIHPTVPTLHCSTALLSQWSRRGDSETAVTHHNHRNTSASTTNTASSTTLICLPPPQYPDDKWITSSHLNMILLKLQQNTGTGHWTWYKQLPASSLWTVAVQTMLKRLHSHGGHVFNFCIKYVHNKWILGPKDPLFFGKSVQI